MLLKVICLKTTSGAGRRMRQRTKQTNIQAVLDEQMDLLPGYNQGDENVVAHDSAQLCRYE